MLKRFVMLFVVAMLLLAGNVDVEAKEINAEPVEIEATLVNEPEIIEADEKKTIIYYNVIYNGKKVTFIMETKVINYESSVVEFDGIRIAGGKLVCQENHQMRIILSNGEIDDELYSWKVIRKGNKVQYKSDDGKYPVVKFTNA